MKLWPASDLAEAEFEAPTFLVDPIIPLGGLVMLHGKRGIGKTQFLMTQALAVTNGWPLFGRWPVTQGPVVYIQTDMTPQLQKLRLSKIKDLMDLADLYYTMPGSINITKLDLKKPKSIEKIRSLEPVLVIWDTLRKIHRGNENSSETVQSVYSTSLDLFPTATHEFAHHDKKTHPDPDIEADPEEQFRGSGDWIDSAEASLQLVRAGEGRKEGRVLLRVHKARTAPPSEKEPFLLDMDPGTMLMLPPEGSPLRGVEDPLRRSLCSRWALERNTDLGLE